MARGKLWTANEAALALLDRFGFLVVCINPALSPHPIIGGQTRTRTFGAVYVGIEMVYEKRGTQAEWDRQRRILLAHGAKMPLRPPADFPEIWRLKGVEL